MFFFGKVDDFNFVTQSFKSFDVKIAGKDETDSEVVRDGDFFSETGMRFVLKRRPGSYIMR